MNRTKAGQIIAAADKMGELDELLYFIEMEDLHHVVARTLAATYPAGWIPVVPLAPDPRAAEHYAHLLCALLEDGNRGRGILFRVELSSHSVMDGYGLAYYVWGESIPVQVDAICAVCGGVHRVTPGQSPVCAHAPLRPCWQPGPGCMAGSGGGEYEHGTSDPL